MFVEVRGSSPFKLMRVLCSKFGWTTDGEVAINIIHHPSPNDDVGADDVANDVDADDADSDDSDADAGGVGSCTGRPDVCDVDAYQESLAPAR